MAGLWVGGRWIRVLRRGLAGEGAGERRVPKLGTQGWRLRRVCLGGVKLACALRLSVGDGLARVVGSSLSCGCQEWIFRLGLCALFESAKEESARNCYRLHWSVFPLS